MHSDLRVTGSASLERIINAYTKKDRDKLWAFVVLGNTVASRDRSILTDGTAKFEGQSEYRQNLYQRFNVYTFDPAKTTYASSERRDRAEELRVVFFKCLLGVKFNNLTNSGEQYKTVFVSDNIEQDTGAYYIHNYEFETNYDINSADIVNPPFSVAWKDFEIKTINKDIDNNNEIRNIKGKLQGD